MKIDILRAFRRRVLIYSIVTLLTASASAFIFLQVEEKRLVQSSIDNIRAVTILNYRLGETKNVWNLLNALNVFQSDTIVVCDNEGTVLVQSPEAQHVSCTERSDQVQSFNINDSDGNVVLKISAATKPKWSDFNEILIFIFGSVVLLVFLMLRQMRVRTTKEIGGFVQKLQSSILTVLSEDSRSVVAAKKFLLEFDEEVSKQLEGASVSLRARAETRVYQVLADQVAHDIRSPLATLEMISAELTELNELNEQRRIIIRAATSRIRDIANSLVQKKRVGLPDLDQAVEVGERYSLCVELFMPLIDSLVTEKRLEYRNKLGLQIDFIQTRDSYGLFSRVQVNELKRVLSNIINNSVESLSNNTGRVEVDLGSEGNFVRITISDNGRGIPADVVGKLGIRGASFQKEGGSGLGLFHAFETIKKLNGKITITSKEGVGTSLVVLLPKDVSPKWFVPKIVIKDRTTIVIFDDDQTIHQIWRGRFESLNNDTIELRHFNNPNELKKFYSINFGELENALFLIDHEIIGFEESGLDLIKHLGIQAQSILVTSRYEEHAIRETCDRIGMALIPKSMAGFVPIEILELTSKVE